MRYLRSCLIGMILLPFAGCVDVVGDDDPQESTMESDMRSPINDGGGGGGPTGPQVQPTSPP
jgi:hypothetical protein